MAFLRKEQRKKYTCISNDVFHSDLSLKARGMLCTMLSLPDNWEFSENGLQAILKDGQASIRSAIKELEHNGFLFRTRERDESGRMGKSVWIISDYPRLENPSLDSSNLGNRPQLNTKESNTKELNTKRDSRRFAPPSIEEVRAYCIERQNNVNPQRFIDHYESNGWMVGRNKMKDWRAAVRTWESNAIGRQNQKEEEYHGTVYDLGLD